MAGRTIVVDEAGLVSIRQMQRLFQRAGAHSNRLLLVGDIKQHSSVEAGDALRAILRFGEIKAARLTHILRQKNPAWRQAVSQFAQGNSVAAMEAFDRLGAVTEFAQPVELMDRAADDYLRTIRQGKTCLAISPVWSDIHAFTARVRQKLMDAGILCRSEREITTFQSYQWTKAERQNALNYLSVDALLCIKDRNGFLKGEMFQVTSQHNGMVLVQDEQGRKLSISTHVCATDFDVGASRSLAIAPSEKLLLKGNLRDKGLKNGEIVQVASVASNGNIELADGRTVPAWFRQVTYGYAVTSHASQGKTVDRGILIMSEEGARAANLARAYVSNSRFRESQAIYVQDVERTRLAVARSHIRKLAMEAAATLHAAAV